MVRKRHSRPRKTPQIKLLLDEGLPPGRKLPQINSLFNVKHIRDDFNKGGVGDDILSKIAVDEERIIVTFNNKHFLPVLKKRLEANEEHPTIVGLSTALDTNQIDTKLASKLKQLSEKDKRGKFIKITKAGTTTWEG